MLGTMVVAQLQVLMLVLVVAVVLAVLVATESQQLAVLVDTGKT
jgi:hypothetical protein